MSTNQQSGSQPGDINPRKQSRQEQQEQLGETRTPPAPVATYGAGSEGFTGEEDPSAPVISADRIAAEAEQRMKDEPQKKPR